MSEQARSAGEARPTPDPLAAWIAAVTRIGTAVAMLLVASGVVVALVGGPFRDEAASIIGVGLLALALMPVAQVSAAAAAFARLGEPRYLFISLLVIGLLVAGIAAATVLSRSVGA